MEQVKNLDDKRVCDQSKDGKVIVIRKKDCITRITANADRTLKVTHEYAKEIQTESRESARRQYGYLNQGIVLSFFLFGTLNLS